MRSLIKHALLAIVVALLACGCDRVRTELNQRLANAARTNDIRGAYLALLAGADPDIRLEDNRTPLYIAVENDFEELIDVLIAKGAKIDAVDDEGRTPLHVARTRKVVERLLARGAAIEARARSGDTPLTFAAASANSEAAIALVDHGAAVNTRRADGLTPLHLSQGQIELARRLLAAGADVSARGGYDANTPLISAAAHDDPGYAGLLLEKGADIRARNARGNTPLHIAAGTGRPAMARFLLAHGAEINARNNAGETPLIVAASNGRANVLPVLLAYGADSNASDKAGGTALTAAKHRGEPEVIRLLETAAPSRTGLKRAR